jgi:hypothetical protein
MSPLYSFFFLSFFFFFFFFFFKKNLKHLNKKKRKEKLQFTPSKLTMFFNSNTKVLIFAIHPHKISIYFNSTNIISKFTYCPYFLLFIINKKNKFGGAKMARWQIFFKFFIKIKRLGAIWEVLDTIG